MSNYFFYKISSIHLHAVFEGSTFQCQIEWTDIYIMPIQDKSCSKAANTPMTPHSVTGTLHSATHNTAKHDLGTELSQISPEQTAVPISVPNKTILCPVLLTLKQYNE